MAYGYLESFMYGEVAEGVGAWFVDAESNVAPTALSDIVKGYVDNRSRFASFMLKRDIGRYLKANLTATGLKNTAPFDYELCFSEQYFGCSNQQFLQQVSQLLDVNLKRTKWRNVKRFLKWR
jgi:hypothetical protein